MMGLILYLAVSGVLFTQLSITIMRQRMKKTYLFVLPWDLHHPGGVNQVVANLMDKMTLAQDYEPMLLVKDWDYVKPDYRRSEDRATVHLRLREPIATSQKLKSFLSYLFALPRTIRTILQLIRDNDIQVVNSHYPTLADFNWLLLKKLGLFKGKIFISLHGLDVRSTFDCQGVLKFAWKQLLSSADKVVTCSEGLRKEVIAHYGLSPEHIVNIYNGVDVPALENKVDEAFRFTKAGAPYLLNIGTFEHKKGHDVLLKAFNNIAAQVKDINLIMVGRSGDTSEAVRKSVEESPFRDQIFMYENLEHSKTLALLKAATVFVLSSRNEAFAVVLLEAGGFKQAVVATDICGVGELIDDGISGLLVPSEAPALFAEKVVTILNDEEMRESFSTTLHENVMQNFTWNKAYLDYVKLSKAS